MAKLIFLEKHNEKAKSNLKDITGNAEKEVQILGDKVGSLGKTLIKAVESVKTSGTDLGEHVEQVLKFEVCDNLVSWANMFQKAWTFEVYDHLVNWGKTLKKYGHFKCV